MLDHLVTEKRNEKSMQLDEYNTHDIIALMNKQDASIIHAVHNELPTIERVINECIQVMKQDGRIIYVGAGTSGRIGMLDAVECPPTFGTDPNRVVGILAGGNGMFAKEEAEDSYEEGQKAMQELHLTTNDIVIGLAASGRTPFVIAACDYANSIKAHTACIVCNKHSELSKHVTLPIEVDNGPEIITGSTRLKAGTSQKMICNMITTATMVRLGKVYENLMVDVDVSNTKLYQRWLSIVQTITKKSIHEVEEIYEPSHHQAKVAILMLQKQWTYEKSMQVLKTCDGFLKQALAVE